MQDAREALEVARSSAISLSEAQEVIAPTLEGLRKLGMIADSNLQNCPLCDYRDSPTLSRQRIDEVSRLERRYERFRQKPSLSCWHR